MTTGPTTTSTSSNTAKTNTSGSSNTSLTGTNNTVGTTANQTQNQSTGSNTGASASSTAAWAPAQPLLEQQLSNISQFQNAGPTAAMTAGIGGLEGQATALTGEIPAVTDAANGMLAGGGYGAANPDVRSAYGAASGALTPMLSSDFLDFNKNPQIQEMENTIRDQVQNAVGGEFAASGRGGPNTAQYGAPNGQYAGTIAKNITQQEAPVLLNEYNTLLGTQRGAASDLTNAANSESGALNSSAGGALSAETSAPGMLGTTLQPWETLNAAGTTEQMAPVNYATAVNNALLPIAQSGQQAAGTTSGTSQSASTGNSTGQSTSNNTVNMLQDATNQSRSNTTGTATGSSTTTTPVGQTVLGTGTSLLGAWLGSDPRMKKDAAQVGMLFDGTPVHKFKYKGSNTTRIGLMSPQVQQRNPAAVKTGKDGLQRVNYELATRQSQRAAPLLGGGY